MASLHPQRQQDSTNGMSAPREGELPDTHSLMEENAQLRELVIHLSKLVIKGVVERK